jgi:hypothetical protein
MKRFLTIAVLCVGMIAMLAGDVFAHDGFGGRGRGRGGFGGRGGRGGFSQRDFFPRSSFGFDFRFSRRGFGGFSGGYGGFGGSGIYGGFAPQPRFLGYDVFGNAVFGY